MSELRKAGRSLLLSQLVTSAAASLQALRSVTDLRCDRLVLCVRGIQSHCFFGDLPSPAAPFRERCLPRAYSLTPLSLSLESHCRAGFGHPLRLPRRPASLRFDRPKVCARPFCSPLNKIFPQRVRASEHVKPVRFERRYHLSTALRRRGADEAKRRNFVNLIG